MHKYIVTNEDGMKRVTVGKLSKALQAVLSPKATVVDYDIMPSGHYCFRVNVHYTYEKNGYVYSQTVDVEDHGEL
jgi:hypothetical protein